MRADTQTISIAAPPERVAAFVADPRNLPRWAVGFAKSVHASGEAWTVVTPGGEVPLIVESHRDSGVVDFRMMLQPGLEVLAASRAVPRGGQTEYVFTQFQTPGMPDDVFAQSVTTVQHELVVLRALLEVECPL